MTRYAKLIRALIQSAIPTMHDRDDDVYVRARTSVRRWRDANGESATFFTETNENLDQIIAGLQPNRDDRILAICGSGDQAFAIAEYGARVFAVDNSAAQIAYAKCRAELLERGKAEMFIAHGKNYLSIDIANYFSRRNRLDAIRSNLDRVSFHVADVFSLPADLQQGYTKIYLSNAHQYLERIWHDGMHDLVELLEPEGLLYAAMPVDQFDDCCRMKLKRVTTHILQKFEGHAWSPSLYAKRHCAQREREEREGRRCQGTMVET